MPFLTKHELLIRLAVRHEKVRGRLEVLKVIVDMVADKPEMMRTAPPEYTRAVEHLPEMEEEQHELASIIHWLTKERQ